MMTDASHNGQKMEPCPPPLRNFPIYELSRFDAALPYFASPSVTSVSSNAPESVPLKGQLAWADRLFNPWLSEFASVGGVDAAITATVKLGNARDAAAWQDKAEAFASVFGRRQRVFAGPWCRVLEDKGRQPERERFWSMVRATPHLDWMLLMNDASDTCETLPSDWGAGYKNVWIGAKGTGAESVDRALIELAQITARRRFLMMTPLLGDAGDLDLTGIGWVLLNGAIGCGAEAAEWVASVKLQAMYCGVPVWFENPQRIDLAGTSALALAVSEQPRG